MERKGLNKLLEKSKIISHIYLFLVVNFGWVIFRITNLKDGWLFIKRMLMPWLYREYDVVLWKYCDKMTIFVFICSILGMGIIQEITPVRVRKMWRFSIFEFLYSSVILIACILAMASNTYNPFIYFQF